MGWFDAIGNTVSSTADALTQSFDFEPDYGYVGDAASSSSWFTPVVSGVADWGTAAFDYLDNHEWAANALAGGAAAGLSYLVQKDAQKNQEKLYNMQEDRADRRHFVGGTANTGSYGSLTNGLLTNGNKRV